MTDFQSSLIRWYRENARDLPWRETRDPYAIWVSEIMLQQTRVEAVIPYFLRWMNRFPNVESLAEASEEEIHALWQGLGYYRRGRLLHQGAKFVAEHGFPQEVAGWREVPGVGEYTAGAIASIAQGLPAPIVDGNVERVYARITDCDAPWSQIKKKAWVWAADALFEDDPGAWNQALMELGATICTPKSPKCTTCPVQMNCLAFANQSVAQRPVSKPPTDWKHVQMDVRVYESRGLYAVRRIEHGWWQGLYEFPRTSYPSGIVTRSTPIGHVKSVVTNHKVEFECQLVTVEDHDPEWDWRSLEDVESLPLSKPMRSILNLVKLRRGTPNLFE